MFELPMELIILFLINNTKHDDGLQYKNQIENDNYRSVIIYSSDKFKYFDTFIRKELEMVTFKAFLNESRVIRFTLEYQFFELEQYGYLRPS